MPVVPHRTERLTDLWRLGPAEVIALVGAGGKSSLMEAVARDYEAEGAVVLLTTTTKILPPVAGSRPLVTAPHLEALLRALREAGVGAAGPVGTGVPGAGVRPMSGGVVGASPVVGRGLTADGKVEGLPPEWVPVLRDIPGVAAVLVEADGSIGRPLKAPAAWEPVVPACTSLVVAVAGLDSQGIRLDAEHVHRPELLAELLGLPLGAAVPPAALLEACVAGYAHRTPSHAGFLVFFNKADLRPPAPELLAACSAAGVEVWSGSVGSDAAGAAAASRGTPGGLVRIRGMRRLGFGDERPPAVVLAAGLAVRMGGPKVLASLGEGTVLGRVVALVQASGAVREVVVVAGSDGAAVEGVLAAEAAALSGRAGLGSGPSGVSSVTPVGAPRVVRNESPEEGMSSSLRAGLRGVHRPPGVVVLLGDQPFVRPETVRRVVDEHMAQPRAAAAGLAGGPGGGARPPVFLHRSLLPQILELRGDEGARRLLAGHAASVVCVSGSPEEAFDVDRPEDLEAARRRLGMSGDPQ
ncbi:MAG: selenium cofactor biosynthesis protein YqeC [Thermoleophilia bacterium]